MIQEHILLMSIRPWTFTCVLRKQIMFLQIERTKLKIQIEGKYFSLYRKPCVLLKYSWDELLK